MILIRNFGKDLGILFMDLKIIPFRAITIGIQGHTSTQTSCSEKNMILDFDLSQLEPILILLSQSCREN